VEAKSSIFPQTALFGSYRLGLSELDTGFLIIMTRNEYSELYDTQFIKQRETRF
jgi:hypothetical protein